MSEAARLPEPPSAKPEATPQPPSAESSPDASARAPAPSGAEPPAQPDPRRQSNRLAHNDSAAREQWLTGLQGSLGNAYVQRVVSARLAVQRSGDPPAKEPLARIRQLNEKGLRSGLTIDDANEIGAKWGSFGEKLIPTANANFDVWQQSVRVAPVVAERVPQVRTMREKFRGDIKGIALGHLDANEK